MSCIVLDFTPIKKLGVSKGQYANAFNCYFFVIWYLKKMTFLQLIKKAKDLATKDAQKFHAN